MRPAAAILLALFALVAGCNGTGAPVEPEPIPLPASTPERCTEALFRFAAAIDDESTLPGDLVRDDLAEEHAIDLLDLLETLAGSPPPRILGVELFPDTDRAAVDVEFDLPGEGFALWSVQLERGEDQGWRVVWAQGPENGWPPRKRGRGEGLSTSETGSLK